VKVRFQADADLNEDIVKGVLRREQQVDFRTATASGLRSLSDLQVLRLAARENRVLVTHDRKTMPQAFAEFIRASSRPGLLIVSQKTDLLAAIEGVLLVWLASEAEECRPLSLVVQFIAGVLRRQIFLPIRETLCWAVIASIPQIQNRQQLGSQLLVCPSPRQQWYCARRQAPAAAFPCMRTTPR
jgi:predicted nuclease of predicted toxin-antitoxin system